MADLESLLELASILEQQNDFHEVLRLVTQKAASIMQAETALVMMINPSTRETVKTIYKEDKGAENKRYQFVHTYFSGWVFDNRQPLLAENVQNDSRFNRNIMKDLPITSVMCVPLMAEGIITGSLLLLNKLNGGEFSKGDFEYLKKFATIISPFIQNVNKIQQYFATKIPNETLLKKYEAYGLIGNSKIFIDLLNSIEASARCDVRVLLEGGSGTGKELIAKAIHHCSSRVEKKFIAIDCGAIPANLIESELFGHVKGAFTGATYNRKGLFEEANGGTLFMDEITNLPLDMQSKLLRVLQESEIRPLGSNQTSKVDVRIISASSVSLRKLVEKKQFREDLFYRLNIYPISIPSLNERQEDIPLLAEYFIKKFSEKQKKQIDSFHPDIVNFIQQRCWQGNIRELENFVERLVTLSPPDMKSFDATILPSEFQKEFKKIKRVEKTEHTSLSLEESMTDYEEKLIRKALIENDWNQSKAARVLGISEQTIRYKMQKLKILKPE